MSFTKTQVRAYMIDNISDHYDPLTGEINDTSLAEDACGHFEAWVGDDVPERFFDLAIEVAEQQERKIRDALELSDKRRFMIEELQFDWSD